MTTELLDLPHREASARARDAGPAFLFVNPVEYHGPHLSLHNDRWLSLGLAKRLAEAENWPFQVGGHIEMGVDPCPGPGTRFSTFLEVRATVLEACRALADLGVEQVVLMTFHGAPLHNVALELGARWLRKQGIGAIAPFHLVVGKLLDLEDPEEYREALDRADPSAPREELARLLPRDMHAGFFETSMAMCLAPDTVGDVRPSLPPCPPIRSVAAIEALARAARNLGKERLARELDFGAFAIAWTASRPFTGYTSWPAAATRESGEAFAAAILAEYRSVTPGVLGGTMESPQPIMEWLRWASLNGRAAVAHPIREHELMHRAVG